MVCIFFPVESTEWGTHLPCVCVITTCIAMCFPAWVKVQAVCYTPNPGSDSSVRCTRATSAAVSGRCIRRSRAKMIRHCIHWPWLRTLLQRIVHELLFRALDLYHSHFLKIRRPFTHMVLNKDLAGGVEWSWMGKEMKAVHVHLLSKLLTVHLRYP